MVYLDYAATSPMLKTVKKAMSSAMDNFFANASALHTPGHLAMNEIEKTREQLAELINADPSEIIFTSGSTESNNTIIRTFENQNVAISNIEHHSIFVPAEHYCHSITPITIDKNGKVCYNESIWVKRPKLVSICLANNELGVIEPLEFWSQKVHEHNAYLHSDLTQALGKIKIDVKKLGLDYATFSAHKIGGPIGVGALYIKNGAPFKPLILGGNQEKNRRGGTYDTISIIGFGEALKYLKENNTPAKYATKVKALRDNLATRILNEIPRSSLNTPLEQAETLPNILNVSFEAAEGESIQLYLDAAEIIVTTGSACASGDGKPSHVIMSKTGDAEVAHSSIRFSFGLENTEEDVEKVMQVLPNIIEKLQGISTL